MTGDAAIEIDLASIELQALSRRIVEAARLAVAVHLYESAARPSSCDGDRHHTNGRRIGIGGAGPFVLHQRGGSATDGENPATSSATADLSRRPSIFFNDGDAPDGAGSK
jgi:hypothetical protein